jgi:predicted aspartyl protease
MILKGRFLAAAVAGLVLACSASAETPVEAAIRGNDVTALDALAVSAASADERALAQGTALALRHKDSAALALLQPLGKHAADPVIAVAADLGAAAVFLRQSRFADVCRMYAAVEALKQPLDHDQMQTYGFAKLLAHEKPMAVKRRAAGRLAVTRDMAGLARVPVSAGGATVDAIVDTGAGFSTLTESAAKKLGVRLVAGTATVKSTTRDDLPARLGIAAKLKFGDAVLTDVVFIVLPDSALSFAEGKYTIDAIIGLPVFEALGRLELAREDREWLYYGAKPGAAPEPSNLLLDGVQPIILARAGDANLRLFVDTGANTTDLNSSAGREFPALMTGAVKAKSNLGGAGGVLEDADAMKIPALTLSVGARNFDLKAVTVRSKAIDGHHGDIGQDLLQQGKRWAFDFNAMSFSVSE